MDITEAAVCGVNIAHDIKVTVILANITEAARCDSGGTEKSKAQHKIHSKYRCNHVHDDVSIKHIMKEITTADKQRDRSATKATTGGCIRCCSHWGGASQDPRRRARSPRPRIAKAQQRKGAAGGEQPRESQRTGHTAGWRRPTPPPPPTRSSRGLRVSPTMRVQHTLPRDLDYYFATHP